MTTHATSPTTPLLNTAIPCRVLVVDDEWSIRQVLHDFMSMEDWQVHLAPSGEEALKVLAEGARFDVVVTDLKMGEVDGIGVLEAARARDPHTGVIVMTGFGTVESAIEAMKKGAFDYLLKPFKVPDLIRIVHRALERRRLQIENVKLKEIIDIYHASEVMNATLSLDEVLDLLVRTTRETMACDALTLVTRADRATDDQPMPMTTARTWSQGGLPGECLELLTELEHEVLETWLDGGGGGLLRNEEAWRCFTDPERARAAALHDMMVLPLRSREGVWGLLTAFMFTPSHRFSDERRRLLGVLADRGAVALENARLYGDLKETFRQTIQGLAQIIESKDPYTRGHSERVRLYAGLLAEAMGYEPDAVERVREAALLHDIGKISIRLEDLNKDGPLTPNEYEMFKSHTTRGKWLLEPIVFLHPLIPAVYHHHERWDGKGYPIGLAGEDIPMDARIMAVADSYDAMTSNRPYRRALPHEVAVREIASKAGTQFDPEVAEAFLVCIEDFKRPQRERRERWVEILEARGKRVDPATLPTEPPPES